MARRPGIFSRLRRAEIGHHHHHSAGAYLIRYAQEFGLARGPSAGDERPADAGRHGTGYGRAGVGGLMRLLAATGTRITVIHRQSYPLLGA